MKRSRRSFLKIAGISALGIGARPIINALAASAPQADTSQPAVLHKPEALTARHWAMVIDTTRFKSAEDFKPLIEACHSIHNVPELKNKNHEIKWIWEEGYKHAFPTQENPYFEEKLGVCRFWSCATNAKILPVSGPAPPRRPLKGKATASS